MENGTHQNSSRCFLNSKEPVLLLVGTTWDSTEIKYDWMPKNDFKSRPTNTQWMLKWDQILLEHSIPTLHKNAFERTLGCKLEYYVYAQQYNYASRGTRTRTDNSQIYGETGDHAW